MKRLLPLLLLAACPDGGGSPPPAGPTLTVWFAAEEGQNPRLQAAEPEPY